MRVIERITEWFFSSEEERVDIEDLFITLSFGVVAMAWLALLLAEARSFHWVPVSLGLTLVISLIIVHLRRQGGLRRPSKAEIGALLFTISFSVWNALLFHDTFYGGRDPGVFANATVYLSREGSLIIDRFVNYPGWASTNGVFTLNFDFAYVAWLGTFHSIGGLAAMRFANLIPMLVALMAIFFVGKRLVGEHVGGFALLGIATAYPIIWFVRGTFNEIFFMALVWFGVLSVLVAWQKKTARYLIPAVLAFGLAMHTRLEGILVFLMVLLVLLFLHLRTRTPRPVSLASVVTVFAVVGHYLLYIQTSQPNYLRSHSSALTAILRGLVVAPISSGMPANPDAVRYHFPDFVYAALSAYHLLWPLYFIPLAVLLALWGIRQKKSIQILAVLAILAPTFIYLRIPFVTLDQPWFLKRYVATIIPLGFLCTSIVVFSIVKRPLLVAPVALLVVSLNLATASPILFHQEYDGMIEFVGDLSEVFSEEDLVLVDRFATGNYKLADPLFFVFGRPTLWVSSSSEFLDHLRRQTKTLSCEGDAFYVTSVESPLHRITETVSESSLELVWSRAVEFEELDVTVDLLHYPGRPPDIYDLNYTVVKSLIEVPSEVVTRSYSVMVYHVNLEMLELGGELACESD